MRVVVLEDEIAESALNVIEKNASLVSKSLGTLSIAGLERVSSLLEEVAYLLDLIGMFILNVLREAVDSLLGRLDEILCLLPGSAVDLATESQLANS